MRLFLKEKYNTEQIISTSNKTDQPLKYPSIIITSNVCFIQGQPNCENVPETFVWLFFGEDWHLVCASVGVSLQYSVSRHHSYQLPQRSASPTWRKVKKNTFFIKIKMALSQNPHKDISHKHRTWEESLWRRPCLPSTGEWATNSDHNQRVAGHSDLIPFALKGDSTHVLLRAALPHTFLANTLRNMMWRNCI